MLGFRSKDLTGNGLFGLLLVEKHQCAQCDAGFTHHLPISYQLVVVLWDSDLGRSCPELFLWTCPPEHHHPRKISHRNSWTPPNRKETGGGDNTKKGRQSRQCPSLQDRTLVAFVQGNVSEEKFSAQRGHPVFQFDSKCLHHFYSSEKAQPKVAGDPYQNGAVIGTEN